MVQEKVLDKIQNGKLKVFVVWTPVYQGDGRAKALSEPLSAGVLTDPSSCTDPGPSKRQAVTHVAESFARREQLARY